MIYRNSFDIVKSVCCVAQIATQASLFSQLPVWTTSGKCSHNYLCCFITGKWFKIKCHFISLITQSHCELTTLFTEPYHVTANCRQFNWILLHFNFRGTLFSSEIVCADIHSPLQDQAERTPQREAAEVPVRGAFVINFTGQLMGVDARK